MKQALIVEDLAEAREWLGEVARAAFPGIGLVLTARCDEALHAIGQGVFDLALIDLGLPDGSGTGVVAALRQAQPEAVSVVVTIYDDDAHLFPALQAGAFGYLLKDQPQEVLTRQLLRIAEGEPPLSPPIARRMLAYFGGASPQPPAQPSPAADQVRLTPRETEVLQRVAKGYTLAEIAVLLELSRHTIADYVKQVYRKLNVTSRAEAALEAARRGLVQP